MIVLEKFIKQAETQRDAEQRKRLALQAIDIAIQSKSVRLLGRVSKWTSRFLRDPVSEIPRRLFAFTGQLQWSERTVNPYKSWYILL